MKLSIVANQQATATIVIANREDAFLLWIATEIQRYVELISGATLPMITIDEERPDMSTIIILGSPQSNSWIAQYQVAEYVNFETLQPESYLLKTFVAEQTTFLVVGGTHKRGIMYAAYELIERMGVMFQLTSDILPERKPDLELPALDIRNEPIIQHRGFHMRHFVMPWMGYHEFCQLIDQMAKLKCNYLEFYWYEGAPWIEYSHHGEKRMIGDLYSQETGYTAWRIETFAFSSDDVEIGKQHFKLKRPCASEFQECQTAEQAYHIARSLLNRMIDYAHSRQIEVWLGAGDCPTVPPNLGRSIENAKSAGFFGYVVPPGEPAGVEIWTSILESMIDTYPHADGYNVWLAESYFEMSDVESEKVLRQYENIHHLLPDKDQLVAMGYDQYVQHLHESQLKQGDLGLIHYGKQVIERLQVSRPQAKLGVSLLGRSYLFPVLHFLLSKNIRLQSMESAVCWNRKSRVPMENFSGMDGRQMFLVPRLDDDENEFAMQFNIGLYEHDRVLKGSHTFGLSGVAAQIGKIRGLEHNARYLTEGAWKSDLSAHEFYSGYVRRTFGERAQDIMLRAYELLDEHELFLGLEVNTQESGYLCLQGMGNFFNYIDSRDIGWLKLYRNQQDVESGVDWVNIWGSQQQADVHFQSLHYRRQRFTESIRKLHRISELLLQAKPLVNLSSIHELEYMIVKTEAFSLHLQTCCALLQGMLDYEAAYQAKRDGQIESMHRHFANCQVAFAEANLLAMETAKKSASHIDHPSERHILFRYNVRHLLPIREFQTFIRNTVNRHQGISTLENVNWNVIDP